MKGKRGSDMQMISISAHLDEAGGRNDTYVFQEISIFLKVFRLRHADYFFYKFERTFPRQSNKFAFIYYINNLSSKIHIVNVVPYKNR